MKFVEDVLNPGLWYNNLLLLSFEIEAHWEVRDVRGKQYKIVESAKKYDFF